MSPNPFATIVMAHLKTKGTRKDPGDRLEWKLKISEHIYRHQPREHGLELLRLVDWMMQLPPEQAIIYEEGLEALEEEHRMGYIPSFARKHWDAGLAKGLADGEAKGQIQGQAHLLARQLEKRFGPLPASAKRLLQRAAGDVVEQWGLRLLEAQNLEEVFGTPLRAAPKARSAAAAG